MMTPHDQIDQESSRNAAELVVSQARKCYSAMGRTVSALDDVSFEVARGDVCLIIGTNGSGKSTLLQAVAGLLSLDAGIVTLDGKDVSHISSRELARVRGILYQHPLRSLCPGFSISEMVVFYGDGLDGASFHQLFASLERIGLAGNRTVSTLSGGQAQILALELVLARRPSLILLDEPTASLDVENAELVRKRVRDAAAMGVSVLFVSHDIEEALALADRLLFLHAGRLVKSWQGEELAVLSEEALRNFVRTTVAPVIHSRPANTATKSLSA